MTPKVSGLVPESLLLWRVAASAEALDRLATEVDRRVLRLADDEALVLDRPPTGLTDPDAIVVEDGGWVSIAMTETEIADLMVRSADWSPPEVRPTLAQGMVAGLPTKIWLDGDESFVLTYATLAAEATERLR